MDCRFAAAGLAFISLLQPALALDQTPKSSLDSLIAAHAKANAIPESLVHRVVQRESRYNPRAVGRGGAMGLMQIKHATARAMGYVGSPSGLLDAETNLTYAVRYLAGAYKTAGGDPGRSVSYYARGYYYAAKRQGLNTASAKLSATSRVAEALPAPLEPQRTGTLFTAAGSPYLDRDAAK